MSEKSIRSFNSELDRKIGPIKIPCLCLIEGPNDSGKSVVVLQYCYGALQSGLNCYLLTTESSMRGIRDGMASLSLDPVYFLISGRLKVGEMHVKNLTWNSEQNSRMLKLITSFIKSRKKEEVFFLDSMTYLVTNAQTPEILNFFTTVRNIVDSDGKTIFLTIHTHALNTDLSVRLRSIADAHFMLNVKEMGERIVRTLQVMKLKGAERSGLILAFEVDQAFGIRVLPFSQAKA
ncbi:MAG: ATPase domain-containing protein [Candidatus Caldarchaeum sp.]|uniref:KaiC-like domain-containing protein n=1 Tax=Caldiarchaeum subterraneum TaxID=311458 RepID=A0A7C5L7M1_CALS0